MEQEGKEAGFAVTSPREGEFEHAQPGAGPVDVVIDRSLGSHHPLVGIGATTGAFVGIVDDVVGEKPYRKAGFHRIVHPHLFFPATEEITPETEVLVESDMPGTLGSEYYFDGVGIETLWPFPIRADGVGIPFYGGTSLRVDSEQGNVGLRIGFERGDDAVEIFLPVPAVVVDNQRQVARGGIEAVVAVAAQTFPFEKNHSHVGSLSQHVGNMVEKLRVGILHRDEI